MLAAPALAAAFDSCAPSTFAGRLYRAVQMQYLQTLTSTEGAWKADNRFTAAGVSQAMYVAQAPDLAMLEATRQFQKNFDTPTFPAYSILPVDVDLRRVLDMTRDECQDAVGTSLEELSGDWRAARKRQLEEPTRRVTTHDLGAAARAAGFEGLKYFSAYDASRWNIVVFTENLTQERQLVFDLPDAVIQVIQGRTASQTPKKRARKPTA
jgi:RES domain-containing protein